MLTEWVMGMRQAGMGGDTGEVSMMKISNAGIELIKRFEGLRLTAYAATSDEAKRGIWTIGYGSTYWPDGRKVKRGDVLNSEKEAEYLLANVVSTYEAGVNRLVKVQISQNQFDALVSFAFNLGVSALGKSTLLRKLNSGDINGAAAEFLKWVNAGGKRLQGLVNRREAERTMFLK